MDWIHYNFKCAEVFYATYRKVINEAVTNKDEFSGAMVSAAFANNAFACEVYLKCILSIEGIEYKKAGHAGHDLSSLFSLLTISKNRIIEIYNSISNNEPTRLAERRRLGDNTDYSIEGVLEEANGAYKRFRYSFQKTTHLKAGEGRGYRVNDVINALRIYIKELKPEWNQIKLDPYSF